jgi:primase-polymerase (primpol)-like protein
VSHAEPTNATTSQTPPPTLPVLPDGIPEELRQRPRWLLWCWELRKGKWAKPPHQINGRLADSTDPGTWTTFAAALAAYQRDGWAGIGYALRPDDDASPTDVGGDIDRCRVRDTGELLPWGSLIVATMATYSELSPTATGLRFVGKGRLPGNGTGMARPYESGKVELYQQGRYVTFTGHRLPHAPDHLTDLSSALPWLRTLLDPRNGPKLRALWSGDIAAYPSASEADLALCGLLGRAGVDAGGIDRLFRRSGLFRPKWDELRGRQTYGAMTIDEALNGTSGSNGHRSEPPPPPLPAELAGKKITRVVLDTLRTDAALRRSFRSILKEEDNAAADGLL